MKEYKVIENTEIVWSEFDDRYIYIRREYGDVVGINFAQGDELEIFKEHYCCIDKELTTFYSAIQPYLSGKSELDQINQAIWAYFDYRNLKDAEI